MHCIGESVGGTILGKIQNTFKINKHDSIPYKAAQGNLLQTNKLDKTIRTIKLHDQMRIRLETLPPTNFKSL